jgi:hypothetical protein
MRPLHARSESYTTPNAKAAQSVSRLGVVALQIQSLLKQSSRLAVVSRGFVPTLIAFALVLLVHGSCEERQKQREWDRTSGPSM